MHITTKYTLHRRIVARQTFMKQLTMRCIAAMLLAGAMTFSCGYPAFAAYAAQGASDASALSESGPGSEAAAEAEAAAQAAEEEEAEAQIRQNIINAAMGCIGTRYVWGGESPVSGMDCSGLTRYVIRQVLGIELPHSAAAQAALGTRISREELEPGDLVFYSFEGSRIDHAAMYLGDGKVIHTSATRHQVVISNLDMGSTSPDAYVRVVGA